MKVIRVSRNCCEKYTFYWTRFRFQFASVSKKVHTTRHRAIGVLTEGDTQIVSAASSFGLSQGIGGLNCSMVVQFELGYCFYQVNKPGRFF